MIATGYERLRQSGEDVDHEQKPDKTRWMEIVLAIACALTACSLVLSLSLVAGRGKAQRQRIGVLHRPNAYMGLDKIAFPANATFQSFVNFPRAIYQIDPADAHRQLREDDRHWMSEYGTVVPEDQHVLATRRDSSILQFRAMDWGMERCVLHLNVPAANANNSIVRSGSVLDIWSLDSDGEIVPHIALGHAPHRRELLASLEFDAGQSAGRVEFFCASGSFPTFEFACSTQGQDCSVDFWQDKTRSSEEGVFIVQHWSKGSTAGQIHE